MSSNTMLLALGAGFLLNATMAIQLKKTKMRWLNAGVAVFLLMEFFFELAG